MYSLSHINYSIVQPFDNILFGCISNLWLDVKLPLPPRAATKAGDPVGTGRFVAVKSSFFS